MSSNSQSVVLFASKLGYQTRSFEVVARKLGVQLSYVTDRCHELSDPWGDHAIAARFANPEEAAATAMAALRGKSVDAILALGDTPAVAASYAARGLGLRGNHPAAVEACRSKLRSREVLRDAGLLTPWFRNVPLLPEPEPALLGITYPCVLKPLALSASQGVMRANNHHEFRDASRRLLRLLERPEILSAHPQPAARQALVEEYIPGIEVALEGLLIDGELKILAIFDKPDPLEGPYFEETIYVTPSRLDDAQQSAITDTARDAVRALGLTYGPVHAEFRVNERGVWPIEVAPRPIGGMCAASLAFTSPQCAGESVGLEELILRHAIGHDVHAWQREAQASGVMMISVPSSGMLEKVSGEDAAKSVRHITDVQITARLHDTILAWPEGSSYLGFIFGKAETPSEVEAALRAAHSKLVFQIQSALPVEHPVTQKIHNR